MGLGTEQEVDKEKDGGCGVVGEKLIFIQTSRFIWQCIWLQNKLEPRLSVAKDPEAWFLTVNIQFGGIEKQEIQAYRD